MHMQTLMNRIHGIELGQKCVQEIEAWYVENGKDMPQNWMMHDPEWWVQYKLDQEGKK